MRSITHIPTAPHIAALLATTPALGPEHHWEGRLLGLSGSARSWSLLLSAHIAFNGSVIDGRGRIAEPPAVDDAVDTFQLTGTRGGDHVDFAIWLDTKALAHAPFKTTGRLSVDQRTMTGDWHVDCFYPESCGCGGGHGTYRLERVD